MERRERGREERRERGILGRGVAGDRKNEKRERKRRVKAGGRRKEGEKDNVTSCLCTALTMSQLPNNSKYMGDISTSRLLLPASLARLSPLPFALPHPSPLT